MQAWKTEILLGFILVLAAGAVPAGCGGAAHGGGKGTVPTSGDQAGEGGAQGGGKGAVEDKAAASSLACESSDDCSDKMICVDSECMIPKMIGRTGK